jgi:hypothetical protein
VNVLAQMKITTAYCDVHTTVNLVQATIETLSPLGDRNTIHASSCSLPSWHRAYTRQFGYFECATGQSPDFGDWSRKPRCGQNHHVEYMVLTEIDGTLTWACPDLNCTVTQPYQAE